VSQARILKAAYSQLSVKTSDLKTAAKISYLRLVNSSFSYRVFVFSYCLIDIIILESGRCLEDLGNPRKSWEEPVS
jgi:hypothetical protein